MKQLKFLLIHAIFKVKNNLIKIIFLQHSKETRLT